MASNNPGQKWETVIGLEVHAQIATESKLFSSSSTSFGSEANTQVSFVDAAFPGVLPVVNRKCIDLAILSGIAMKGTVNKHSIFARKNYFYPDLPQGYQISQFDEPLIRGGSLNIPITNDKTKTIRIERIHVEQDAGKSLHDQLPNNSLIDLNRSGIGLMEIVTFPDMSNSMEAAEFVTILRNLLRSLSTCDGNMQEGSLRVDANISVRLSSEKLGTRCEIKNLNSIKFLRNAIDFEVGRQIELREANNIIKQETRLFNSETGKTVSMRSKEDAPDYRYFPDPDLLPIIVTDKDINRIRSMLSELPQVKKLRYMEEYDLKYSDAEILSSSSTVSKYFESVMSARNNDTPKPRAIASWILSELFGILNKKKTSIEDSKINPVNLCALINHIETGRISGAQGKVVFEKMWQENNSADTIIKELNLEQIQDVTIIQEFVSYVISNNSDQVQKYLTGTTSVQGWLIGQVMKNSKGKANPKIVSEVLKKELDKLLKEM